MLFSKFQLSLLFLVVFLMTLLIFTDLSRAEVETIQIHLDGTVNNYDIRQIRRLLSPWVDPINVRFYNVVDKHGRVDLFTTIIEITPKRAYVDVYDITHKLKDQRFRGKHAGGYPVVVKTEATVTGELFAYVGWSRSYIRHVPFWRRWQQTSAVRHALDAGGMRQKVVFSPNETYDKLLQEAGLGARRVEIKGQISGFDGPYPVMSVRKFRVDLFVEPPMKPVKPKSMKEKSEEDEEDEEAEEEEDDDDEDDK